VTDDYPPGDNAFTGEIKWIRFEAGGDSHDHLIDPAHLHLLAMTRQ
jgi:arylsulfatase